MKPALDVRERLPTRHVVDDENPVRSPVVAAAVKIEQSDTCYDAGKELTVMCSVKKDFSISHMQQDT